MNADKQTLLGASSLASDAAAIQREKKRTKIVGDVMDKYNPIVRTDPILGKISKKYSFADPLHLFGRSGPNKKQRIKARTLLEGELAKYDQWNVQKDYFAKAIERLRNFAKTNPRFNHGSTSLDPTDFQSRLGEGQKPPVGDIAQGPPSLVPKGQALYARDCSGCHGEHGEGRSELFYPMLASQHYSYLLREFDLIETGKRGNSNPAMPPILANLSVDDERAIAAYLAQLPAPRRAEKPPASD